MSSHHQSARAAEVAQACSLQSLAVGEQLAGTATQATIWIAIEQSGPYGRDALTQSHFPADIGADLKTRATAIGAKVVLIRGSGKHADTHVAHQNRQVWVARAAQDPAGQAAMVRTEVTDPAELLTINFANLLTGNLTEAVPHSSPDHEPLFLICTHAKRDVCCALKGRPVAIDLVEKYGQTSRVWEVSHLGGHRLAPTAVILPHGYLHGRLDPRSADHAWSEALVGKLALDTCRGRSSQPPSAQVAELAVRAEFGITGLAELAVFQDRSTLEREYDHARDLSTWIVTQIEQSSSWEVEVAPEPLASRAESCGKSHQPAVQYRPIAIRKRD